MLKMFVLFITLTSFLTSCCTNEDSNREKVVEKEVSYGKVLDVADCENQTYYLYCQVKGEKKTERLDLHKLPGNYIAIGDTLTKKWVKQGNCRTIYLCKNSSCVAAGTYKEAQLE